MRLDEYENIFQQEHRHWWHRSLHKTVLDALKHLPQDTRPALLDAGCGTGGLLELLGEKLTNWDLLGLDISPQGLSFCRKNGIEKLLQGSVENLPFANESLDAVVCLDVLYHLQVSDDQRSLGEIYRVLKRQGHLILHLPAFEFLRGTHDQVVHTRHRYSKAQVYHKMQEAGFEIIKCTYRHMILFPLVLLKRRIKCQKNNGQYKSDLKTVPVWLNGLLNLVSDCENRISKFIDLPLGSSLFCIGRKT